MTPEQTRQAAQVMLAAAEGSKTQGRAIGHEKWLDCAEPSWDWNRFEFRVKPEPREWWLNIGCCGSDYVHQTKEDAIAGASDGHGIIHGNIVRVREVIE